MLSYVALININEVLRLHFCFRKNSAQNDRIEHEPAEPSCPRMTWPRRSDNFVRFLKSLISGPKWNAA